MIQIANKYLRFMDAEDGIETILLDEQTIEKPYGSIFYYTSKLYKETGDFQYAIAGNAPFLVEKETGRVVNFGTSMNDAYYMDAYEKGTLKPTLDRYWYPDTEEFSHK